MSDTVKELPELVDGLMALAVKLAKHLKDGFQWHDIPNLFKEYQDDKEFSAYLDKAFDGISNVPAEIKNLTMMDGVGLSMQVMPWIQKLVAELKTND